MVFAVWRQAETLNRLTADATQNGYLLPFPDGEPAGEGDIFVAMARIGVMLRRKDDRIDMPDLFRVAAKLLKKGAIAPG